MGPEFPKMPGHEGWRVLSWNKGPWQESGLMVSAAVRTSLLFYFQRPPTLPLAVAPAFLLLQMGSKTY